MRPRPRIGRKLLVASIGVATISFGAPSCGDDFAVANLVAPPYDASAKDATKDVIDDFPVANLVAPPQDANPKDVTQDVLKDVIDDLPVANLVAPPQDSGADG